MITLNLDMKNNNPVSVDIAGMDYKLFANANQIGTGCLSEGQNIRIKAGESTKLELPLHVSGLGLLSTAIDMLSSKEMEYRINGHIILNTMIGKINYPLDIRGKELSVF